MIRLHEVQLGFLDQSIGLLVEKRNILSRKVSQFEGFELVDQDLDSSMSRSVDFIYDCKVNSWPIQRPIGELFLDFISESFCG